MNHDEHRTPPTAPVEGPTPTVLPMPMRGPADMAEMLPYLLGFFPDDSIVAVGLQGPSLHQGAVVRVDLPDDPEQWGPVARDAAALLLDLSEQRDRRPDQVLLYLVRDPADPAQSQSGAPPGGAPRPAEPLRPLADDLAAAFRTAGVAVKESLFVSGGRWWSFLCTRTGCCDPDGTPIRPSHRPSPVAAAAAFAGLAPRGSRRAMVAGLAPVGPPLAAVQRQEIERAGPGFLQELAAGRTTTVDRTGELITDVMAEFRAGEREIDAERTARLLLGLQDKLGRDRGAEFAERDELAVAQRVWRFLVQRCVSPFEHLAAPPLTLLAWTAWIAGDTATARIMLSRALEVDSRYTLALLLYESINGGLAPERLLASVREQRANRVAARPATHAAEPLADHVADPRTEPVEARQEEPAADDPGPDSPPVLPVPPAPVTEPGTPRAAATPSRPGECREPDTPSPGTGPITDGGPDSAVGGPTGAQPAADPVPTRGAVAARPHRPGGHGAGAAPRAAAPGRPPGGPPHAPLRRPTGPAGDRPRPAAPQARDRAGGQWHAPQPGGG
ncbi:DUF4192 domain-containing protein [Streptomyces sp. NRRL B-24484]|uniref:DUF4192 domain-containing protein n=1 Tax=Streptomyces sp. NRRL B-24484 TaxID=1463833 RepID=UPI000694E26B|nr:DUF4192 domain-containing protein [Streptomyces sp. NRRL B-24484]